MSARKPLDPNPWAPSRRGVLLGGAAGGVGLLLRSLATGLPPAFLANPHRAFAQGMGPDLMPQTLIFATSELGDPINCNAPGAYEDPGIEHPAEDGDPEVVGVLPSAMVQLGRQAPVRAAAPWAALPEVLRKRLAVFHLQTRSVTHVEQPQTLTCHGSVKAATLNGVEMLPSMLAELGAPALGTIQQEPVRQTKAHITVGGLPLQGVSPSRLKALFGDRDGGLGDLRAHRDAALDALYGDLRANGTRRQRRFMDRWARSRDQARDVGAQLGALLARVPLNPEDKDGAQDQLLAAVALAQLGVAPVITVKIPFGGDNHGDRFLLQEAQETVSGVARIGELWQELLAAGLQDRVSFALLNVFGRNLYRNGIGGRDHEPRHGVMVAFGAGFQGGVYGGVTLQDGALPIDPATGEGRAGAFIPGPETLEAAAKTLTRGLGYDLDTVNARIRGGAVIDAALRS